MGAPARKCQLSSWSPRPLQCACDASEHEYTNISTPSQMCYGPGDDQQDMFCHQSSTLLSVYMTHIILDILLYVLSHIDLIVTT